MSSRLSFTSSLGANDTWPWQPNCHAKQSAHLCRFAGIQLHCNSSWLYSGLWPCNRLFAWAVGRGRSASSRGERSFPSFFFLFFGLKLPEHWAPVLLNSWQLRLVSVEGRFFWAPPCRCVLYQRLIWLDEGFAAQQCISIHHGHHFCLQIFMVLKSVPSIEEEVTVLWNMQNGFGPTLQLLR